MSTKTQRQVRTEERGLLNEDLHPLTEKGAASHGAADWRRIVTDSGGNPLRGKEYLRMVASGRAGIPAMGGAWPKTGPKEWREGTGVSTLDIAYLLGIPTELIDSWEEGAEPWPGNWLGGDFDDLAARRLYAAFRGYCEAGPYPEPSTPEAAPERPPVEILMGDGFPRKELLEAASLGYEVEPWQLVGEGKFLKVVVAGEVVGIPVLKDIPSGAELRRIREGCNYTPERWGVLLGAAASRVLNWEAERSIPGADCEGGLAAALRLYGTCQLCLDLRPQDLKGP